MAGIRKNNFFTLLIAAVILCFYAFVFVMAQDSVPDDDTSYWEDIDLDGDTDLDDVYAIMSLGHHAPNNFRADYNNDSVFDILDAVSLLISIKNGRLTPVFSSDTNTTDTTNTDTTSTQKTYVINGYVICASGGMPYIEVTLSGEMELSTFTNQAGMFSFQVPDGTYTVMPVPGFYVFNPPSMTIYINGFGRNDLSFIGQGVEL